MTADDLTWTDVCDTGADHLAAPLHAPLTWPYADLDGQGVTGRQLLAMTDLPVGEYF